MSDDAKPKGASNLTIRLLTAVVMVPVLLALLYLAPLWGFLALVAFGGAVAAWELFAMVAPGDRFAQGYGVLASLGAFTCIRFESSAKLLVLLAVALTIGGLLVALLRPDPIERAGMRLGWMIAGPLYTGGLVATLSLLHARPLGGSWVVLSMMLAWWGDTGGYFAGRAFGKHKLYEKVSPNKTIEGSMGGIAGSVLGALVAHFWYLRALPLVDGVVLAVVAGMLGQMGDLAESLLKRAAGVKDSGVIVPGHGGLLDRIDALVFTSAATWAYATFVLDGR